MKPSTLEPPKKSSDSAASVRALERGLDILDCLQAQKTGLSLTEIALAVDLSPSTTFRILSTLEKRAYLVRHPTAKTYMLGEKMWTSVPDPSHHPSLPSIALSFMQELNTKYGESIGLYIPAGMQRICIQRVESSHPLRQVINVGDRLSLSVGAGGKVLVAWLTAQSALDPRAFLPTLPQDLLQKIRQEGYATSFGERVEGVYAVAAPLFGADGHIIAALSFSGPTARFDAATLPAIIASVKEKAEEISAILRAQ